MSEQGKCVWTYNKEWNMWRIGCTDMFWSLKSPEQRQEQRHWQCHRCGREIEVKEQDND